MVPGWNVITVLADGSGLGSRLEGKATPSRSGFLLLQQRCRDFMGPIVACLYAHG
jgi:hypothetical protein